MERLKIPAQSIKTPAWGSTQDDNVMLSRLKNIIRKYGQLEEVVVRNFSLKTYEVIAGRNILKAMIELGMKEIQCVNVGQVTESEARAINVIKNHNTFPIDHLKMAECVGSIQKDIPLHIMTQYVPFTADELNHYIKVLNFDWDSFADKAENQVSMFDEKEFYEGR